MKLSPYCEYVVSELMRDISGVTARPMMGGYCLYKDGQVFGMVANDNLYFKVGDSNKADYEQHRSLPFRYANKGKEYTMSYWEVPEQIQDDSVLLREWIRKSVDVKSKK